MVTRVKIVNQISYITINTPQTKKSSTKVGTMLNSNIDKMELIKRLII